MKLIQLFGKLDEAAYLHVHKNGKRVVNDKESMGDDWETKLLRESIDPKEVEHWTKYAGHRDFDSEDSIRRLIAGKAKSSLWNMGMSPEQATAYYNDLAANMPVYQTAKGWRIGDKKGLKRIQNKRSRANRFTWDKVDLLDVAWTNIFSLGLINQFDVDKIVGPKRVPLKNITPNERHDQEHAENIAAQIKENLEFRPIVLDSQLVIVDGHHRFEAAKILKMRNIPAYIVYTHDDEV